MKLVITPRVLSLPRIFRLIMDLVNIRGTADVAVSGVNSHISWLVDSVGVDDSIVTKVRSTIENMMPAKHWMIEVVAVIMRSPGKLHNYDCYDKYF